MNLRDYLNSCQRGEPLRIATALSVHPVMVSQWANGVKKPAIARCTQIERTTLGAVSCEELRPDVTWARIADPEWPSSKGRPVIDPARSGA